VPADLIVADPDQVRLSLTTRGDIYRKW
jgi:hypothetical protein